MESSLGVVAAGSSPLQRLDPRAKLLLVLGALVVVLSEPAGALRPYAPYYAMTLTLLVVARVPPAILAKRWRRWRPSSWRPRRPTGGRGSAGGADAAMSVVLRAVAAVALVTVLVATERMSGILWGLSGLGMPRLFSTQSAFMYRFALLLGDEAMRTERARRSRSPGPGRNGRLRTLGGQAALVFLRGWKRSRAVYNAMLSRGFTGHIPFAPPGPLRAADLAVVATSLGAFMAVRLLWP
jgi:cobalt/nickel transport system permease protein